MKSRAEIELESPPNASGHACKPRVTYNRNASAQSQETLHSTIVCNADMRVGEIRQFCKLPEDDQSLMRAAMSQLNLSAQAYHRILKLARTIADLAGCEEIQSVHLAEALHTTQPAEVDVELGICLFPINAYWGHISTNSCPIRVYSPFLPSSNNKGTYLLIWQEKSASAYGHGDREVFIYFDKLLIY